MGEGHSPQRPLLLEALHHWWRLLPVLWLPILIGYAAAGGSLAIDRPGGGDGVPRALLWLGSSWLGMAWAAAACAEAGTPHLATVARRLRAAGWRLWATALLRAGMVYGPALLVYAVGAARAGVEQQVGQANPVPALALVLLPLALILAALFAPLPSVLVIDRPRGFSAALNRAKQLGDPLLAATLGWGGLLMIVVSLTSALPLATPRILPNHAVGSLLWVLLAVGAERARQQVDGGEPGPDG